MKGSGREALIANEPKPVQILLQRKIVNLTMAWDEFARAHDAVFGVVADDKMAEELVVFHAQSMIYNEALDKATVFEASYSEPVAVPPPLEVKVEDLLLRRTTSYDRAEEKVDGILEVLVAAETPLVPASIQAKLRMLEDVEGNLGTALALTDKLIDLASDRAELFRSTGNTLDQVVQRKVQQARTQAGDLGILSAQQTGAEEEGVRGYSRNAQLLFEKRPSLILLGLSELPELSERVVR